MDHQPRARRPLPAEIDLERGHDASDHDHTKRHYIQDFTFRFLPLCIAILVVFSDGAILVCTLAFNKPIPRQGVVVVSVMLAVFFALFGLGGACFHHQKRYAKRHRRRDLSVLFTRIFTMPTELHPSEFLLYGDLMRSLRKRGLHPSNKSS